MLELFELLIFSNLKALSCVTDQFLITLKGIYFHEDIFSLYSIFFKRHSVNTTLLQFYEESY